MKKPDFDVSGTAGYEDIFTAFNYSLDAVKVGQNIYFSYSVNSNFLQDIVPGVTWRKKWPAAKRARFKEK